MGFQSAPDGFCGYWIGEVGRIGLRDALWHKRSAENEEAVAGLLAYGTVKAVYLHGATKPELISPDNWNSDFYTSIQKPNGRQIQLDLFYDYRKNVELYPKWQSFLKERQPKTIIFWGQDDIFFTRLKRGQEDAYTFMSTGSLGELQIPLPPLPLQQKFAALIDTLEHLQAVQREALRQADHLFATLLHRAFNGWPTELAMNEDQLFADGEPSVAHIPRS